MQSGGEECAGWTGASHPTSGNILHHSKLSQGMRQLKGVLHSVLVPLPLLSSLWKMNVLKFSVCEIDTHVQLVGRHVHKA